VNLGKFEIQGKFEIHALSMQPGKVKTCTRWDREKVANDEGQPGEVNISLLVIIYP
jgi:hypothetical protein